MKEELLKIINNYGVMPQLKYIHTEYFELDEAIFQYDAQKEACENIGCSRIHVDKCREHIAEEIADVMVMLKQFQYYYGIEDKEIEEIMKYKVERTIKRMENEYYEK